MKIDFKKIINIKNQKNLNNLPLHLMQIKIPKFIEAQRGILL